MPTTKNPVVEAVNLLIHAAIMEVAAESAIDAAVAAQPWLGLPIINTLFRWAVKQVFGFVSKYTEQTAAFAIIGAQTGIQNSMYEQAVQELASAQKSEDPNEREKAKQRFKDTLKHLVNWDGS